MTDAVRCLVFEQTFSGPAAKQHGAVQALRTAGFDVREHEAPHDDKTEQRQGWITAEHVDDSGEHPDADRQQQLMADAADAATKHGYELRSHGIVWTWRTRKAAA